jgi:hypothetical protein
VIKFPAELIQEGGEILLSTIHKLINSVWNKEELSGQWKESIIVPEKKKSDKTDCSTGCGKKTSPIWRGRCVSCGGDTAAEGVSIDSG